MRYDEVVSEFTTKYRVYVYERPMRDEIKGLYADNIICINRRLSNIEKVCAVTEEVGHYHTSTGNILDQSDTPNRQQEHRARVWAYTHLVPLYRLIEAGQAGISGRHDVADYLNVTEEFLQHALDYYASKYGIDATCEGYKITFDPLQIEKII